VVVAVGKSSFVGVVGGILAQMPIKFPRYDEYRH